MRHTIHDKGSGAVLASGEEPAVLEFEGNLYFDPGAVEVDRLVVTDATYTCPYKGTCNWVDVRGGPSRVAWVYPDTKPGFEQIQGRYGFYRGDRPATRESSE